MHAIPLIGLLKWLRMNRACRVAASERNEMGALALRVEVPSSGTSCLAAKSTFHKNITIDPVNIFPQIYTRGNIHLEQSEWQQEIQRVKLAPQHPKMRR
jgi:hypothetical protein